VQENRILLATRSVLWPKTCRKCDSDLGSAPDLAGVAHNAPPNPLVGWRGDIPPHTRPHSVTSLEMLAPSAPRSSCPPDTKTWRRHWSPPLFKLKLRLCNSRCRNANKLVDKSCSLMTSYSLLVIAIFIFDVCYIYCVLSCLCYLYSGVGAEEQVGQQRERLRRDVRALLRRCQRHQTLKDLNVQVEVLH